MSGPIEARDRERGERGEEEYWGLRERIAGSRMLLRVAPYHKMHLFAWLRKLDQCSETDRKIRNNHAKLLTLMCECEVVVAPFDQPPPEYLPRLSKQRINQIIDEVEEAVRIGQEIEGVNENSEAVREGVSEVVGESEGAVTEEERSWVIGRFVNESLRRGQEYSGNYFSVMEESREEEAPPEKKTFFSETKVDGNYDCPKESIFGGNRARHIRVEINTFQPQPPASPAFEKLRQSRNSQPSPSFSDTSERLRQSQKTFGKKEVSSNSPDQTLKTELLDQDSIIPTNPQQIQEILNEDPDFSSQLSERCRGKDEPRNSQIAWAFKENLPCEPNFHKRKLTLTESIPSKSLFRTSKFNCPSRASSVSNETSQDRLRTDPDESFNSNVSLASELRSYDGTFLRDLTNIPESR